MKLAQEVLMKLEEGSKSKVKKSKGHIGFTDDFEYFERGGEVFRAPFSDVIMPDGRRSERWEGSVEHFGRYFKSVHKKFFVSMSAKYRKKFD